MKDDYYLAGITIRLCRVKLPFLIVERKTIYILFNPNQLRGFRREKIFWMLLRLQLFQWIFYFLKITVNDETSDDRLVKYLMSMIYDVCGWVLSRRRIGYGVSLFQRIILFITVLTFFIRNDDFSICLGFFINIQPLSNIRIFTLPNITTFDPLSINAVSTFPTFTLYPLHSNCCSRYVLGFHFVFQFIFVLTWIFKRSSHL